MSNTGTLLSRGAYSAWGSPYGGLLPSTPFAWNGRWGAYRDGETGLLRMGARYYAPALGRFLSRDPSGFVAGPNLYTYGLDDPVNLLDPTGRQPQESEGLLWQTSVRDFADRFNWHLGPVPLNPIAAPIVGLHDLTGSFGGTSGLYDAGKASAGQVWMARLHAGVSLGTAATALGKGVTLATGALGRGSMPLYRAVSGSRTR